MSAARCLPGASFGSRHLRISGLGDPPLSALRARGVRLYVDDFGTGYSSLSYLHAFLFHSSVIAEGVDNAKQLAALRGLGCDTVQGYHFSPPLPGDKAKHWLTGNRLCAFSVS